MKLYKKIKEGISEFISCIAFIPTIVSIMLYIVIKARYKTEQTKEQ
jgi:ABC-type spermidine/putrescine transport system permease subunit II